MDKLVLIAVAPDLRTAARHRGSAPHVTAQAAVRDVKKMIKRYFFKLFDSDGITVEMVRASHYDAAQDRISALAAALRTQPCARPSNGQEQCNGFGYVSVAGCIAAGNCGCDAGAALASQSDRGE